VGRVGGPARLNPKRLGPDRTNWRRSVAENRFWYAFGSERVLLVAEWTLADRSPHRLNRPIKDLATRSGPGELTVSTGDYGESAGVSGAPTGDRDL